MYPFSEQRPKPILPVLNRPLLAYQIDVMRDAGITDIHIVVGRHGYQIASLLGDGAQLGVRIHYVDQESTLGLAHAVGGLESRIDSPFLLMLGDIQFHLAGAIRPLIDQVLSGEVAANLVSRYEPDPEMLRRNFAILADDTGRVRRVIEKPRFATTRLKGCGLYVFDPRVFDAIRRTPRTAMRDEYEITDSIQIMIEDGWIVHHHPIVERDLNLTRAEDLLMINLAELDRQHLPHLIAASAHLAQGTRVEHSVIGPGVVVTQPLHIVDSVVMADVCLDGRHDLTRVVTDGEHVVYCPGLDLQAHS
jgi:dTDP-glucose pyrophosphorylase